MKIRIGKEIHISWSILTQGENKPLEGRDLRLYLQDPNRRRRALEFTTDDNTLLVVIPANTLTRIGKYALILTENEGQEGQTAVDANPAFTLVETTREEDTNTTEAPNLDVATINLATGNLTLRMVLQELFSGKEGGDMKTGDILAVLRDGELHRVSVKIGAGSGADYSAEIEALTAKVEENAANIAGAAADASAALTAAQGAQAAATSASENAAQAKELATEVKTTAEQIQGTADSALSEATSARSDAANAATDASNALSAANAAQEVNSSQNVRMDSIDGRVNNNQERISAVENKNTEQDTRINNIESRLDPEIAGRVWNEDNATPKAEGYYGSLKALRYLPKRLGLGRYLVTDVFDEDGNIVTDENGNHKKLKKKLDPNDSTKYIDGSTAALDGSEGQCMWCWNGFYANIWHEGSRLIKAVTFDGPVGLETSVWIPAGGISWLGAGVIDRGDAPYTDKTKWKLCSIISDPALYGPEFKKERYRGGSGVAVDPSKFSKAPAASTPQITMLGMPATMISTTDFGKYARKRGLGWEANWFVARFVVEFLFEVIMGTENSQDEFKAEKDANGLYQGGFGNGVTDTPDWYNYNGFHPLIPTSVGLEAGDNVCIVNYSLPQTVGAEGDTYHTYNVPVFFGLVGAGFGNLCQWTRGLIMDAGDKSLVYVTPSMYADYDPNTVADKILVAECPQKGGCIKRKSYQGLCCMPTEVGGSSTTRFSDYLFTNAATSKGLRVRSAGGGSNDDDFAGESCIFATFTHNFEQNQSSAPLCYFEKDPIIPESEKIEI